MFLMAKQTKTHTAIGRKIEVLLAKDFIRLRADGRKHLTNALIVMLR